MLSWVTIGCSCSPVLPIALCLGEAVIVSPSQILEQQEQHRWRLCRVRGRQTKIVICTIPMWIRGPGTVKELFLLMVPLYAPTKKSEPSVCLQIMSGLTSKLLPVIGNHILYTLYLPPVSINHVWIDQRAAPCDRQPHFVHTVLASSSPVCSKNSMPCPKLPVAVPAPSETVEMLSPPLAQSCLTN